MKETIQSIERAFQILATVYQRAEGIGVSALATETGLHISTTSRIVSTLENIGALERVGNKLLIGNTIVTLASRAPWTDRLISFATPYLRELVTTTQEAVGLTLIEEAECIVFYQIPSNHHIQIRDWTGERFPLHVTSSGKVFLAGLGEDELAAYLDHSLNKVASNSKSDWAELQAEFPQIRAEGVAWTIDELEDGLTSVAAPIYREDGRFLAGLYVSMPTYRVGDTAVLAEQVHQAANDISTTFGYETV